MLSVVLFSGGLSAATLPEITVINQARGVELGLQADAVEGSNSGDTQIRNAADNGPYVTRIDDSFTADGGASASGFVEHESRLSSFRIEGESSLGLTVVEGAEDTSGIGTVRSTFSTAFTIPVDAPFSLSGRLEGFRSSPSINASMMVTLSGLSPSGGLIFIQEQFPATNMAPVTFLRSGSFAAGPAISLAVQAVLGGSSQAAGDAEAGAEFRFALDFGDTDADGLLDGWETDGIDVDSDGTPDIDLPALGANPRKKDLFVEVDAFAGTPTYPAAFEQVKAAFAKAPAEDVKNPDGSAGITLHILLDETDVTPTGTGENPGMVSGVEAVRDIRPMHFGTDSDRNRPDWESDLRPVRRKVYRYCLIVDSISDGLLGQAEYPGDDAVVAFGALEDSITTTYSSPVEAAASLFMHELGHNLHLHHGGHDDINYKPNYLSVMNYMYGWRVKGLEDSWELDYSRGEMTTLDEASLNEGAPLNGPLDRKITWRQSPPGSSETRRGIGEAWWPKIDWNYDGELESELPWDLNAVIPGGDPSPAQTLEDSSDWAQLWYHLSGHPAFAAGASLPPPEIPRDLPLDVIGPLIISEVEVPVGIRLVDLLVDEATGLATVTLLARPGSTYRLLHAPDLDFTNASEVTLTAVVTGTLEGNFVTTNANGRATVRFSASGIRQDYLRAELP